MARRFTKNTANYLSLGVAGTGDLIDGSAAISLGAWIYMVTTTTAANDNRIFTNFVAGTINGFSLAIENSASTRLVRVGGRSVTGDSFQARNGTTDLRLSAWHYVGGVLNYGADTITPYANGVAENSGAVTFVSSTYDFSSPPTSAVDGIGANMPSGAPGSTAVQFDGLITEVALWRVDIGPAAYRRLYGAGIGPRGGADPRDVAAGLVFLMDLQGTLSPEVDAINRVRGVITGAVPPSDGWRRLARVAA